MPPQGRRPIIVIHCRGLILQPQRYKSKPARARMYMTQNWPNRRVTTSGPTTPPRRQSSWQPTTTTHMFFFPPFPPHTVCSPYHCVCSPYHCLKTMYPFFLLNIYRCVAYSHQPIFDYSWGRNLLGMVGGEDCCSIALGCP